MADRYARNNHAAYTPPPCKLCGKPLAVDWIDDTRVADASPWDVPVLRRSVPHIA